jgi:hypothetical protein
MSVHVTYLAYPTPTARNLQVCVGGGEGGSPATGFKTVKTVKTGQDPSAEIQLFRHKVLYRLRGGR